MSTDEQYRDAIDLYARELVRQLDVIASGFCADCHPYRLPFTRAVIVRAAGLAGIVSRTSLTAPAPTPPAGSAPGAAGSTGRRTSPPASPSAHPAGPPSPPAG